VPDRILLPNIMILIDEFTEICRIINGDYKRFNLLLTDNIKVRLVKKLNEANKTEIYGDSIKITTDSGCFVFEPWFNFIKAAHGIALLNAYKVYYDHAMSVKEGLPLSDEDWAELGREVGISPRLKNKIKKYIRTLSNLSDDDQNNLILFMTGEKEERSSVLGSYKMLSRPDIDTFTPVLAPAMGILAQYFDYTKKLFKVITDLNLVDELKNLKPSEFGKLVFSRTDLNDFAFLSFKELMKKFTIEQLLNESSTTKCTQWGNHNLINLTVSGVTVSGEDYKLSNLIGLYANKDIGDNNEHLISSGKSRFQEEKLDSVYFGSFEKRRCFLENLNEYFKDSSSFSYYFSSEWGHVYPDKLDFTKFKAYVEKVSMGQYKLDCHLKDPSKPKEWTYLLIDLGDQNQPLNQILYGPPGSGKTYNAVNHALSIALKKDLKSLIESQKGNVLQRKSDKKDFDGLLKDGQIRFVTFHQSYSYEDFVEGIKPRVVKNNIEYHVEPGVFKQICLDASCYPEKNYVLIIDEINRGNISKIFGELITLIEDSKRIGHAEALKIKLVYSGIQFGVPNNVYIIGTMNTADKSIALVDLALRRRFTFIEYPADPTLLEETTDGINLKDMLTRINKRIQFLLDKDHSIGHSYLMGKKHKDEVLEVFRDKIIPLLREYFHNDFEQISWVLGDHGDWKGEGEHSKYYLVAKVKKEDVNRETNFGFKMGDKFEGREEEMYELNQELTGLELELESLLGIYDREAVNNKIKKIAAAAAATAALPPASGGTGSAPASSSTTP